VEETTAAALRASDERLRIGTLTLLDGVSMPTASVLLHLAHKDPYPIIDYRALWSLGIENPPPSYSFEFWQAYTRMCRSLARQAGVSMRLLDRALWQFSKEQQPAPAPASAARLKPLRTPTSPPPQRTKSATMRGLFEDGWTVAQVQGAEGELRLRLRRASALAGVQATAGMTRGRQRGASRTTMGGGIGRVTTIGRSARALLLAVTLAACSTAPCPTPLRLPSAGLSTTGRRQR